MKAIIPFLFALFLPFTLPSLCCVNECSDWKLEVRAAYYQTTSKKLGKIYSNGWLDYQVETSRRVGEFFEVWGGVYWANKHGKGRQFDYGFKDSTKIHVLPICLGAKFVYPLFKCAQVYFGAGGCYSFLKIHNHCEERYSYWGLSKSPFKKNIYKYSFGGVFKTGIQITLSKDTFLDIFADYIAQRFKLPHHDDYDNRGLLRGYVDCSGFKFGAGIGVYF